MDNENKECRVLSEEEMERIDKIFDELFSSDVTVFFHEVVSDTIHIDLRILYDTEDDKVLIHTEGMSNTIMPNGKTCEVCMEFPNHAFNYEELIKIYNGEESSVKKVISEEYLYAISDLLKIARAPEFSGEVYKDLDTIILEDTNSIYGFMKLASDRELDMYLAVPLSIEEHEEFKKCSNQLLYLLEQSKSIQPVECEYIDKLDEKKDCQYRIRLSNSEFDRLSDCAKYYKKTKSSIIREALDEYYKKRGM